MGSIDDISLRLGELTADIRSLLRVSDELSKDIAKVSDKTDKYRTEIFDKVREVNHGFAQHQTVTNGLVEGVRRDVNAQTRELSEQVRNTVTLLEKFTTVQTDADRQRTDMANSLEKIRQQLNEMDKAVTGMNAKVREMEGPVREVVSWRQYMLHIAGFLAAIGAIATFVLNTTSNVKGLIE